MKKLILMLFLVVGGILNAGAWTSVCLRCDGHWDSNDSGYEFTKLSDDGNNWSIILDGSVITNGPFYFRFWVSDYNGGNGNEIEPASSGSGEDQVVTADFVTSNYQAWSHEKKAFYVTQCAEAEKLQIYLSYYDDIWHIAASPLKQFTIAFVNSNNYEKVNFYSYVSENFIKFTGAWPGDEVPATGSIYTKTFWASPSGKIIFNNNGGSQTGDFALVNNGVYDASGLKENVPASVSSLGYATFSSAYPLDFTSVSDVTAYRVSEASVGVVKMEKVTGAVPAGYGLLLKSDGAVNTNIPTTVCTTSPGTNMLVASVTDTPLTGEVKDPYRYILAADGGEVGFYYVNTDRTSGAGKAYLESASNLTPASARVAMVFDDEAETTGIKELKSVKADGIFNLRGQRVMNAQKGLYIVNGKKMLMK